MNDAPSNDVRARLNHVLALVAPTARSSGSLDWRETWLTVTLAIHELEACLMVVRRQFP
jgi:hypothetical protein